MKINVDQLLLDAENKPIKGEKGKDVALKTILINALYSNGQPCQACGRAGEKTGGEEKYKRGLIVDKLKPGGEIELIAEEVTLIKKLVGDNFPTLVVHNAYPMLEGIKKEAKEEEKK